MFVLRDPVDRFVSGFYSRKRQGMPRYYNPWSEGEREAFSRFETPDELARALSADDGTRRREAAKAMHNIRHVNVMYRDWLGSVESLRSRWTQIFWVGWQPTLGFDFAALIDKIGLSNEVELPKDEVNAHRTPHDGAKNLCDEAVRNLEKWYEDDYSFIETSLGGVSRRS
jgi:hypothetical protein